MTAPFRLEPFSEAHDRYFRMQVTQDIRRHIANCFVALDRSSGTIAGFYTIAAASVPTPDLPAELTKRLPRYPSIPAVRVGRLAVDRRFHRRGLGGALLVDAAQRTLDAAPAAYALIVDAEDDQAIAFYRHHGFQPFASQPRTLFLPLATAARLLLAR